MSDPAELPPAELSTPQLSEDDYLRRMLAHWLSMPAVLRVLNAARKTPPPSFLRDLATKKVSIVEVCKMVNRVLSCRPALERIAMSMAGNQAFRLPDWKGEVKLHGWRDYRRALEKIRDEAKQRVDADKAGLVLP